MESMVHRADCQPRNLPLIHLQMPRQLRFALWVLATLVLGLFWSRPSPGQTTEPEIASRLVGHPLYLRGCWDGYDLKFDSAGNPAQSYNPAAFTTSGMDVTKVRLRGDVLRLEGQRVGLQFDKNGNMSRVKITRMKLEIAAPPDLNFGPALDAIFATDLAEVPFAHAMYWRRFGAGRWLPAAAAPPDNATASTSAQVQHVGQRCDCPTRAEERRPALL